MQPSHGIRWWPPYDSVSTFDNFTVRNVWYATVDHVVVTPGSPYLAAGTLRTLVAQAYDSSGNLIPNEPVVWHVTGSGTVVSASSTTLNGTTLAAVANGDATISATTWSGAVGSTVVHVVPVASVVISPPTIYVPQGIGQNVMARAYDASGHQLTGVVFDWGSWDPSVQINLTSDTSVVSVVGGTGGTQTTIREPLFWVHRS